MHRVAVGTAVLVLASVQTSAQPSARAQFGAARPGKVFVTGVSSTSAPGGFLMGSDDCAGAHTLLPAGAQSGVPFTTGTTGTQGQNEAQCYAFGTTGIDNDVWFDWQASATGDATMTTCGGTTIDSKVAVYPLTVGCPADGTALACNDDSCGLQSSVTWSVVAGTSYTFQLGTFPGEAGGSGTFELTEQAPEPCGAYDDGTSENSFGLLSGGETGWLHSYDCFTVIDAVATAYGTTLGSGTQAGIPARLVIYEDPACDASPSSGAVHRRTLTTVCQNPDTDILNLHPIVPAVAIGSRCSFVLATCQHPGGQFPAPMDETNPTSASWIVGESSAAGGMLDLLDLGSNSFPPIQMQALGFPSAWLLRAEGIESSDELYPALCFGVACPCSNDATNSGGCDNSLPGSDGAELSGSGIASLAFDTLVLSATNTPNQPGIFFQGTSFLTPPSFGDGLRCCGQDLVRCGTWLPSGNATDTATGNQLGGNSPPISNIGANASLVPGNVRCYQWWYRDPLAGPCGSGFNLSNSIAVTWGL